jgi:hypothetical protein
MRYLRVLAVSSLLLTLTAACGKSDEQVAAEKAAEEAKEAAAALKKAAENAGAAGAAQGLEGMAKALEGMAGALSGAPGGKAVDPVSFQQLQTVLPEVAGWKRDTPTGERITMPVSFSQAEAEYSMGDAQVTVKIVDSAFSQFLIAPWSMFLATGYEKQSSDGYEKSVNVSGNPGFEKWDTGSKDGELNLVVAKRFLVTIDGSDIADTKVLHEFASKIDAGKLASLK